MDMETVIEFLIREDVPEEYAKIMAQSPDVQETPHSAAMAYNRLTLVPSEISAEVVAHLVMSESVWESPYEAADAYRIMTCLDNPIPQEQAIKLAQKPLVWELPTAISHAYHELSVLKGPEDQQIPKNVLTGLLECYEVISNPIGFAILIQGIVKSYDPLIFSWEFVLELAKHPDYWPQHGLLLEQSKSIG